MEYKILKSSKDYYLEEKVNEHLKLGWKLYGYTFIETDGVTTYYQAMIKEDNSDKTMLVEDFKEWSKRRASKNGVEK